MRAAATALAMLALCSRAVVAQMFVDGCCTADVPEKCCVIGSVSPTIRMAQRFELINTLCSNDCEKYLACVEKTGQGSISLSNGLSNISVISAYDTATFVLGENFCELDCLTEGGFFPNITVQSTCMNAATLNGTCSDECRDYLRTVDAACKDELINNPQQGFQARLWYQVCGISDPAENAAWSMSVHGVIAAMLAYLGAAVLIGM